MKTIKKITAIMLTVVMLMTMIALSFTSVFAVSIVTSDDYDYVVYSDKSYMLYRYHGSETDISLPETFLEKPVVGIWENCFKDSGIESVDIPDSYTYIGDNAFYSCGNLTAIILPRSLETLGIMAFNSCTSIESIDFTKAESIKEIPYALCKGDIMLTSVYIPSFITTIGERAFSNTGLTSIRIPNNVKDIQEYAFSGCENLADVTLPDDLTVIRRYTFSGCKSLDDFSFPSGIETIEDYAFMDAVSLNISEFPNTLKTIGYSAFKNDVSIENLFIPDSVTSIGAEAFAPMSYSKTINVTCYDESYAAEYCYNNRVENLITIEKLIGDADLNGEVNILDVTCIQKYKIGENTISTYRAEELADVNKDGNITIRDATLIQMYLAKIITEF